MYRKSAQNWLKHLDFLIVDLICLHIAYFFAYSVRLGIANPYAESLYRMMAIILTLISIVVSIFFETFRDVLKRGYYMEFMITIKHVFLVELFAISFLFVLQEGASYSRLVMGMLGIFYIIFAFLGRVFWKHVLRRRMSGKGKRSLLIVTIDSMVDSCVKNIRNNNYEMFNISGIAILDRNRKGETVDGVRVVANADEIADYVCQEWIDEVFLNLPPDEPRPETLIQQITRMGIVLHVRLTNETELIGKKQFVETMGTYTVLTTSINYATPGQLLAKRLMDIAGGLTGCLITAILFVFLAPAIKIKSPGPVFFSQIRVGKNGKKFKMYKFRTMYLDAEERKEELMKQNRVKDGLMFKMEDDPRIIGSKILPDGTYKKGIGNYMRDFSLDEFPQFFNVLKGDMSLIGTRPPTVDEWEKYELHHRVRLSIKPGITGIWQVSGRSNITDFEKVVKLDAQYISQWSIGLDLKILLKTIGVVFNKEGSM